MTNNIYELGMKAHTLFGCQLLSNIIQPLTHLSKENMTMYCSFLKNNCAIHNKTVLMNTPTRNIPERDLLTSVLTSKTSWH